MAIRKPGQGVGVGHSANLPSHVFVVVCLGSDVTVNRCVPIQSDGLVEKLMRTSGRRVCGLLVGMCFSKTLQDIFGMLSKLLEDTLLLARRWFDSRLPVLPAAAMCRSDMTSKVLCCPVCGIRLQIIDGHAEREDVCRGQDRIPAEATNSCVPTRDGRPSIHQNWPNVAQVLTDYHAKSCNTHTHLTNIPRRSPLGCSGRPALAAKVHRITTARPVCCPSLGLPTKLAPLTGTTPGPP
jgi:hypothetical protein